MLCLRETTYLVYKGLLNQFFYGLSGSILVILCLWNVHHAVLECEKIFTRTQVSVSPDCVIRGCRDLSSQRKSSGKSKKVSLFSTPTLDTQTVPLAAEIF